MSHWRSPAPWALLFVVGHQGQCQGPAFPSPSSRALELPQPLQFEASFSWFCRGQLVQTGVMQPGSSPHGLPASLPRLDRSCGTEKSSVGCQETWC